MSTRLQPGDCCAGHEIVQHLSTGGSAEVYAARLPSGALRALKIMAVERSAAPSLPARFAQEGEALALIVHPSVIRFHDAGVWGDRVWLSLELAPGETLGQRLRAPGRPPLDDLLSWIQQACEGLAEAHRVGVFHRDLTPENLLVMPGGAVKVIGFGMAKLRAWGVATTREQQIGSAKYRPPEQVRGAPAQASMDIYAIGQVLYEALAGEHAMGDAPRSMIDVVAWQLSGQARPLRERAPELPSDLEALVHQAIEKDPARRPASMRAFIGQLREVQARLRAPQRRAARNVPFLEREPVLAPTIPMAAVSEATAPERAALLPAAPTLVSARPAHVVQITIPMAALPLGPPAFAELRSTDAPIEIAIEQAPAKPRRATAAALVALAITTLAAAGWMLLGPLTGARVETSRGPRAQAAAAVSASATASALPAPMASSSAPSRSGPGAAAKPAVELAPSTSRRTGRGE